jgi:hypothetical protein
VIEKTLQFTPTEEKALFAADDRDSDQSQPIYATTSEEFASYIKPRKRFKIKKNPNIDNELILKNMNHEVNRLDMYIRDIEPNFGLPVLFKKYIKQNAKLIGFNIDPKFNNCLDGLMLLDIFDVPISTIKSLSKEINDDSILKRFNLTES